MKTHSERIAWLEEQVTCLKQTVVSLQEHSAKDMSLSTPRKIRSERKSFFSGQKKIANIDTEKSAHGHEIVGHCPLCPKPSKNQKGLFLWRHCKRTAKHSPLTDAKVSLLNKIGLDVCLCGVVSKSYVDHVRVSKCIQNAWGLAPRTGSGKILPEKEQLLDWHYLRSTSPLMIEDERKKSAQASFVKEVKDEVSQVSSEEQDSFYDAVESQEIIESTFEERQLITHGQPDDQEQDLLFVTPRKKPRRK